MSCLGTQVTRQDSTLHSADLKHHSISLVHIAALTLGMHATCTSRHLFNFLGTLSAQNFHPRDSFLKWLTSPIITASSGLHPKLLKASVKNVFSGFPTTVAVVPVAYSRASTKGPGPRARPSSFLKYFPLWIAIRGAPSRINLEKGNNKGHR